MFSSSAKGSFMSAVAAKIPKGTFEGKMGNNDYKQARLTVRKVARTVLCDASLLMLPAQERYYSPSRFSPRERVLTRGRHCLKITYRSSSLSPLWEFSFRSHCF